MMNNSYIRKNVQQLVAYAPGEQPRISGLIKLNTNENPYPPSPAVEKALRELSVDCLRLYPDPMCTAVREQLGKLHGVKPSQVFVANGSDEVLRLCIQAFTERDGMVAAFDPTYSLYPVLAAAEGVRYVSTPLTDDFSWQDPSPEALAAGLFILAYPNAPTGIQYPLETVEAFCSAFKGVVLLDEAYVDFAPYNGLELAKTLPNVLICRTLSKSWSLAGLRVGYAVGPVALIEALYKLKDSYNVDRIAQTLALAAFSDEETMRENVKKIIKTREATAQKLNEMGYQVFSSSTNFLWISPPSPHSAEEIFQRLREDKILVRHFSAPRTRAYLRVTVGTEAQMDAFLAALPTN